MTIYQADRATLMLYAIYVDSCIQVNLTPNTFENWEKQRSSTKTNQ